MAFKDWLADAMADAIKTQADLVRLTGRTSASVSRWVNGEDLPGIKSCGLIARALGRPLHEVLRAAGHELPEDADEAPATDPVPLERLSRLADELRSEVWRLRRRQRPDANTPVPFLGDGAANTWRGHDLPDWLDLSRFSLRASGDCLQPDIQPGQVLIFDRERRATVGSIVAAQVNGEQMIKRVVEMNGRWVLGDARGNIVAERDNIDILGVFVPDSEQTVGARRQVCDASPSRS